MNRARIIKKGASYNITATVNRGVHLMKNCVIRDMLYEQLKAAKEKFKMEVYNFCFLDNSIQMIIKPSGEDMLPVIMRWFLGTSAARYNRLNGQHGSVWASRYKSEVIEDTGRMLQVFKSMAVKSIYQEMSCQTENSGFYGINLIHNKTFDLLESSAFQLYETAFS